LYFSSSASCSLLKMLLTCPLIVFSLKTSFAAISALDMPSAINFNTSNSRSLNSVKGFRLSSRLPCKSLTTRAATRGCKTASPAARGIELQVLELKDIMFPGELKNIFTQVVNTRKEGLAALERARAESASLRNLANAARLFEDNSDLRQLRLFQMLEKSGTNTVVFS